MASEAQNALPSMRVRGPGEFPLVGPTENAKTPQSVPIQRGHEMNKRNREPEPIGPLLLQSFGYLLGVILVVFGAAMAGAVSTLLIAAGVAMLVSCLWLLMTGPL